MPEEEKKNPTNPFPKGNFFWKLRRKHGRGRYFSSPEMLALKFMKYVQHVENHPLYQAKSHVVSMGDFMSKVEQVDLPVKRPYTLHGFCLFAGVNTHYFNDFKKRLKIKEKQEDADFAEVIADIENCLYAQKFEGAASGFFNANLISRDLGLADRQAIQAVVTDEKKINISVDGKDIDLSK